MESENSGSSVIGSTSEQSELQAFVYAGFWIRFVAHLIDYFLISLVSWLLQLALVGAIYWAKRIAGGSTSETPFTPFTEQVIGEIISLALATPYYVMMHARTGATLGKRLLKIRVVQAKTFAPITVRQSWVRCLSYVLSYLPFGAGFLMAGFQPEKRALHDLVAGTVSIRPVGRRGK